MLATILAALSLTVLWAAATLFPPHRAHRGRQRADGVRGYRVRNQRLNEVRLQAKRRVEAAEKEMRRGAGAAQGASGVIAATIHLTRSPRDDRGAPTIYPVAPPSPAPARLESGARRSQKPSRRWLVLHSGGCAIASPAASFLPASPRRPIETRRKHKSICHLRTKPRRLSLIRKAPARIRLEVISRGAERTGHLAPTVSSPGWVSWLSAVGITAPCGAP